MTTIIPPSPICQSTRKCVIFLTATENESKSKMDRRQLSGFAKRNFQARR